ncbi:MAG: prolyl-tRNA synthetase associated domain-containing protein [Clostridia bacterium]|nr:prolyl-tRNA synthetase associated domain-containing protein [Clostridia bacterium]
MIYRYYQVIKTLQKMNIDYKVVEHPPAFTTEEADGYIKGHEGVRTKTLLLCDKRRTRYYMLVMEGSKRLDMKYFGTIIKEKGITFASEEAMMDKIMLKPGSVSLFGLLNNEERDIKVCLDDAMLNEEYVTFHGNDNTKTLFIATQDMYKFLEGLNYDYTVVKL